MNHLLIVARVNISCGGCQRLYPAGDDEGGPCLWILDQEAQQTRSSSRALSKMEMKNNFRKHRKADRRVTHPITYAEI